MIILKNKQNKQTNNNLLKDNKYITDITKKKKNIGTVTKSEKDEYNNIIYYPSSKEWFSSVYSYNKSYTKLLPAYNIILNKSLKSYANMIQDKIKILFKRRRSNWLRYSGNRVHVSKAELKHTSTNLFITLYVYNKKRLSFEKNIKSAISLIPLKKRIVNREITFLPNFINKLFYSLKNNFFTFKKWNMTFLKPTYGLGQNSALVEHIKLKMPNVRLLKKLFLLQNRLFSLINIINFDKFKFNSLYLNFRDLGLLSVIEKLYSKKVVMKLVELKSIHLNSDIFSSAIALKLRNRKNNALRILRKAIINMVKLPDLHTLITFDDKSEKMNKNNIIKTIKQQVVSGIRFEASGRLTRRLTAMRAVFKYGYAGSLKSIRTSFNRIPSTMLRGHVKSNSQYSLINSKTRNGTFGLKGWVSSH